ncbi:hypothetical protein WA158_004284 [Blastocystis sp. Blastoise]
METAVERVETKSGSEFNKFVQAQLDDIEASGTYKHERIITSKQFSEIEVEGTEGKVLNFCANNYLGLANSPVLIDAAKKALDTHGLGLASVRFICGTTDIHKELEAKIAKFHGFEDCILYTSCFDANGGFFECLFTADDAIISDELNHASIIDGIRLCKAARLRYHHMDMADLEEQLKAAQDKRHRIIVTDGIFSMDGDVAPLPQICDLADKYNALVWIDESHSAGHFGPTGRGTPEFTHTQGRIDFLTSTLGKAMGGGSGGYTCASHEVINLLRNKSRPYLFSNTLPPALVGAGIATFDMLSNSSELPEKIAANTKYFRDRMTAAGFKLAGDYACPIAPIMLGDAALSVKFADAMLKKGIYVIGFNFPVVPKGKARIRVQISAAHTKEHIDRAVDAFIEIGKELGVIA